MSHTATRTVSLETLAHGIPAIPAEAAAFYKQNCMVCFDAQGHASGVHLAVECFDSTESLEIRWDGEVTEMLQRQYGDLVRATDNAACAIALLLVRELTEYTAIEQASRGTTVDYFLVTKNEEPGLIFNHSARLEATGILHENPDNSVATRIAAKLRRLKPDRQLPAVIAVVEFGKPWSKMVRHE